MKMYEKTTIIISVIASIIGVSIFLLPEITPAVGLLDLNIRLMLLALMFFFALFPWGYGRFKPRKTTEKFPFEPFRYYSDEVKNCISGEFPYVKLFESLEGIEDQSIENRIAQPEKFELPPEFDETEAFTKWKVIRSRYEKEGKEIGTHSTARLFDFEEIKKEKKLVLYFQRAEYWQAHVTNFNLDWLGWREHLRNKIAPSPKLNSLPESKKSANHLGMSCVLETVDGKIVLQKRSSSVVINPSTIGVSAEGHLRWESRATKESAPSPFAGILDEINNELGLTRDEIDDLRLIAIFRDLLWGGKPGCLFVGRTSLTWKKVVEKFEAKPESYWETERLIPLDKNDFDEIRKYIKRDDVAHPSKLALYYYMKQAGQ